MSSVSLQFFAAAFSPVHTYIIYLCLGSSLSLIRYRRLAGAHHDVRPLALAQLNMYYIHNSDIPVFIELISILRLNAFPSFSCTPPKCMRKFSLYLCGCVRVCVCVGVCFSNRFFFVLLRHPFICVCIAIRKHKIQMKTKDRR